MHLDTKQYELQYAVTPLQRLVAAPRQADGMQLEPTLFDPAPLDVPKPGYWGPSKVVFWGLILLGAVAAWAWDAGLDDRWEAFQLTRRVRQRREGKRKFSMAENMDDILQLLMIKGIQDLQDQRVVETTGEQQLGWRRLDAAGGSGGDGSGAPGSSKSRQVVEVEVHQSGGTTHPSNSSSGSGSANVTVDAEAALVAQPSDNGSSGGSAEQQRQDGKQQQSKDQP